MRIFSLQNSNSRHLGRLSALAVLALAHLACMPFATAAQTGLTASYFANESLTGPAPLKRVDATVDFNWSGSPGGSIGSDYFSARWTGAIRPTTSESLTLILRTDDGVRVWLDGQLVINAWVARSPADSTYTFPAVAGRRYSIQIEYFERTGGAVAQFLWQSPTIARQVVPTSALEPSSGLAAFYYANEALSGNPVLSRNDAQVNFNWQSGGPGAPIGVDSFSARWLGSLIAPSADPLTLIARTDDGVRLWLDGALVIDSWIARSAADSTYTFTPVAGRSYAIRLEYFERSGSAVAQLLWQSATIARQAIPASALIPAQALDIALPASSQVSPVFIEGKRLPGGTVTATVAGAALPVANLGDLGFYANAALNASSATTVSVASGTESIAGSVAWATTTVSGEAFRTLRLNDSLLLTSPVAGTLQIVHQCGVEVPGAAIPANGKYAYKFAKPGTYQLYVRDTGGVERGHLEVDVLSVDLDGPIANQVSFRREKGIGLVGGLSSDVTLQAADPTLLEVSLKEQTTYGVRLYLKTLRRGFPQLVARLGGASGPVIASQEIVEFSVESTLATFLPINNGKGYSEVTIRPYVPNLTAKFEMFAHGTTFSGGLRTITRATNEFETSIDPDTGETIATTGLSFEAPAGEVSYCFKSSYDQHSKYGTDVGSFQANGNVVTITLSPDPIRLPFNKGPFKFEAKATAAKPTKFGPLNVGSGPKPGKKGFAKVTKGVGGWSGTTDTTREIELSTLKADGAEQTGHLEGQSVELRIKNGKAVICSVDFCICAHPTNFRFVGGGPAGDNLRTNYEWDSDSGDIADLDLAFLFEIVQYGAQPNPPFTAPATNPTTGLPKRGNLGKTGDTHEPQGAVKGTAGVMDGIQVIWFNCERENGAPEFLYGPVLIHREVTQPMPGVWQYLISKEGLTHSFLLP